MMSRLARTLSVATVVALIVTAGFVPSPAFGAATGAEPASPAGEATVTHDSTTINWTVTDQSINVDYAFDNASSTTQFIANVSHSADSDATVSIESMEFVGDDGSSWSADCSWQEDTRTSCLASTDVNEVNGRTTTTVSGSWGLSGNLTVEYTVDGSLYTTTIAVDRDADNDGLANGRDLYPANAPSVDASVPVNESKTAVESVTVSFPGTDSAESSEVVVYSASETRSADYLRSNAFNGDCACELITAQSMESDSATVVTTTESLSERSYSVSDANVSSGYIAVMTHGSVAPSAVTLEYSDGSTETVTDTTAIDGDDETTAGGGGGGSSSIDDGIPWLVYGSTAGVPNALPLTGLAVVGGVGLSYYRDGDRKRP